MTLFFQLPKQCMEGPAAEKGKGRKKDRKEIKEIICCEELVSMEKARKQKATLSGKCEDSPSHLPPNLNLRPERNVWVNGLSSKKGEEQGEKCFLRKPRSLSLEIQDVCQSGKLGVFLITHMGL